MLGSEDRNVHKQDHSSDLSKTYSLAPQGLEGTGNENFIFVLQ